MKKDYKSILGLETIKVFIIVLLSLAIISVVTLVVLGALVNTNLAPSGIQSASALNESGWINTTAYTVTNSNLNGFTNLAVTTAINGSGGEVITAGNFTVAGSSITGTGQVNYSNANITYTYGSNNLARNGVESVTANTSNGLVSFFGNASTFFALLGVVVIILIISLVVVVVNRFGAGSGNATEAPGL